MAEDGQSDDNQFAALLSSAAQGDADAKDRVIESVYRELHSRASYLLSLERRAVTFQTTALLNEALLRLLGDNVLQANDRNHFLNIAAQQMRRVLVDRARANGASKRNAPKVSLEDAGQISIDKSAELIALDDALQALAEVTPEAANIIELKYFGGFTDAETAAIKKISVAKVRRYWEYARAWLHDYLQASVPSSSH